MKPNDFLTEQQLDELQWAKDLANKATAATQDVKGAYDDISDAGKAVGGLVGQAVGRPIKGAYDLAKKGVTGALKGAGTVAGDVSKGAGAVAGAPAGMARAAKKGYKAGSDYVAGDDAQTAAQATSPEAANIQQQIQQKQTEIQGLEQQLSQVQQKSTQAQQSQSSQSSQTTTTTDTEPAVNKVGQTSNAVSDLIAGATDAAKFGKGMGAAGQSLMKKPVSDPNSYVVKDKFGRTLTYKKVGDKWFDQQGNPVDDNFAASIEQAKQNAPKGNAKTGVDQVVANQGDVNKQTAAQPDELGRIEPTMTEPVAQTAPATAPTDGKVNQQFVGGVPATNTTMPTNMGTYPPKTTDTTQAILPKSTTTKQAVSPQFVGGVPQVGGKLPAASPTMPQGATQPAAAAPKQTKVTTGGPTPAEQANLQKRIQAAQQAQPVAEHKNFSAILWRQMRASK